MFAGETGRKLIILSVALALSACARHRGQLYHLCTLLAEVCIRACIITDPQRLQSTASPPSFMSVEIYSGYSC